MSERDKELSILNYMIKNPDMYKAHKEQLKGFAFEYFYATPIYDIVCGTIAKYGVAPTLIESVPMAHEWANERNLSELERNRLLQDLGETYSLDSTAKSGEVLLNYIFAKESRDLANKMLILSAAEFQKQFKDLQDRFNGLYTLGRSVEADLGVDLMDPEGISFCLKKMEEANVLKVLPTGFPEWDKKLLGGVRAGEVMMILASTGGAKTAVALNIGFNNAVVDGSKRIVYITFDNQLEEIAERVFANWTDQPIGGQGGGFDKQKLQDLLAKKDNKYRRKNFKVQTWLPQRYTPLDVSKYLTKIREEFIAFDKECGIPEDQWGHIDGLIIDYLEKVLPVNKTELLRQDLFQTVEEFVIIAKSWGMPVFVLSQATKESMKVETAQIWMSGESYAKLHPCAHVVIMSQSDDERNSSPQKMKIINGKNRRPETHYAVPIIFDKFRQRIEEDPSRQIVSLNSIFETGARASMSVKEQADRMDADLAEVVNKRKSPAAQLIRNTKEQEIETARLAEELDIQPKVEYDYSQDGLIKLPNGNWITQEAFEQMSKEEIPF